MNYNKKNRHLEYISMNKHKLLACITNLELKDSHTNVIDRIKLDDKTVAIVVPRVSKYIDTDVAVKAYISYFKNTEGEWS